MHAVWNLCLQHLYVLGGGASNVFGPINGPKDCSFGRWPQEHMLAPSDAGEGSRRMPLQGQKKSNPLANRVKVQFSNAQLLAVQNKANAVGMTVAGFVRATILNDLDDIKEKEPLPKRSRNHAAMLQLAEVHHLAMQIKKLGTNVNQLAKQANTGMVPVSREEILYILNQHQLLMSHALSMFESTDA